MIIIFDFAIVVFVVGFIILMICGILESMLSVYTWLISHIFIILLIFAVKAIFNCLVVAKFAESSGKKRTQIILAVIANILQITTFWVFIKEMSVLQTDHPVVTIICTLLAISGYVTPLFLSLFSGAYEDFNGLESISSIICCVLLLISCIVPSWGSKMFFCLISAIAGYCELGFLTAD